jgi:hypothetical protein
MIGGDVKVILKKQLLSQASTLNAAFISKTDTNAQVITSALTISGGALTLKNTLMTDNASASYFKISPQGNVLMLYNGVSNQQFNVFSSSGSEYTYMTSINAASNLSYGLIDIAGASVNRLEINTNSGKMVKFGGDIRVVGGINVGDGGEVINATIHIRKSIGGFQRLTQMSPTGASQPALNLIGSTNISSGLQWWSWGVDTTNIFRINSGTSLSSAGLSIDSSGNIMVPVTSSVGLQSSTGSAWFRPQDSGNNMHIKASGDAYFDSNTLHIRNVAGSQYGTWDSSGITISNGGWCRIKDNSGLYFQDWGGGWNMTDSTWIRAYNNKGIWTDSNLQVQGTISTGGAVTTGGILTPSSTSGVIANSAGISAGLQVIGAGGANAAFASFHRPGSFAAYFGIDTDNKWKVGGWSMGAVAYELWHSGNQPRMTVGATAPASPSINDIWIQP